MGSKGSNTTTQTYTPNAAVGTAGGQALSMAQSAASTPFSIGAAPVQGFSPDQLQAFQQYRDLQGIAQPYYNTAGNLIQSSANPLTAGDINNYYNPMASSVLANLHESQGQQMNDLTGRLTQTAGGVGANRIAVGQSELARQQQLAEGQTLSGLYQNALNAAQQNKQMQANAGYGMTNLGTTALGARLQGTGALYGAGSNQQALGQAQLNSQYQNEIARLAYPFQTAQYLAGITGGLSGALGGTTTATKPAPSLWSQLLGAGTAAVGGLGASGAFGNNGWMTGGGGTGDGSFYGPSSVGGAPLSGYTSNNPYYGPGYAKGGEVGDRSPFGNPEWMHAASYVPNIHMQPSQANSGKIDKEGGGSGGGGDSTLGDIAKIAGAVATVAPMFSDRRLKENIREIGKTNDGQNIYSYNFKGSPRTEMGLMAQEVERHHPEAVGKFGGYKTVDYAEATKASRRAGGFVPYGAHGEGYANGGATFAERFDGGPSASFDDRFEGTNPLTSMFMSDAGDYGDGTFNPYQPPQQVAPQQEQIYAQDNPVRLHGSTWGPEGPPPLMANDDTSLDASSATDVSAQSKPPVAGAPAAGAPMSLAPPNAHPSDYSSLRSGLPYNDLNPDKDVSRGFAKSPWMALINAGAGMMAGTSPYAGINIGQGLQQGVKTLQEQRKELANEEGINLRAKQLRQAAEFHLDQYNKMTPYQQAQVDSTKERNKLLAQQLEQKGWVPGAENPVDGTKTWMKPSTGEVRVLKGGGTVITGNLNDPKSFMTTGPSGKSAPVPAKDRPPPPMGMPDLASDVEPSDNNVNTAGVRKGSPALAQAQAELKEQTKLNTKEAQAAGSQKLLLDETKRAYGVLMKDIDKDGFLTKIAGMRGNNFDERVRAARAVNELARARDPNAPPPINPEKLAAAEVISKVQNTMGMMFASNISSREAWAGQQAGIASTPGLTQSPLGMLHLISTYDAMNQYGADKRDFFNKYVQKYGVATGWEHDFAKKNPVERYLVRATMENLPNRQAAEKLPDAVKILRENRNNPKVIEAFNKTYAHTASYWLTGKLDMLGAQ